MNLKLRPEDHRIQRETARWCDLKWRGPWALGRRRWRKEAGLFLQNRLTKQSRRLTKNDGLPSNSIQAVKLIGPHVWLGGRGWVAVADLASGKVQRVQLLPGMRVGSIQAAGGHVWFSAGGHLYQTAAILPSSSE
jgi:hypothetical protein